MSELPPQARMLDLIMGFIVCQAVRTAAVLEIADRLADGPKSAAALAAETGVHADALHRLLRALASISVFEEREGAFHLTPLAETLKKDAPDSVWPAAILMGDVAYRTAHELPAAVRAGTGAFETIYGMTMFEHLAQNPALGAVFDKMMAAFHGVETPAIVDAYDFSGFARVVDVGGGNGDVLQAILTANPSVHGALFDVPDVVARASAALAGDPAAKRLAFESGDFFKAIPAGGDAYLMRHIIHDWSDEESVAILTRCREAMGDSGVLLVIEEVIPDGNAPSPAKWLDVQHLAAWTGKERSAAEYDALFQRAGFALKRVVPTASPVSVIEAAPA